MLVTQFHGVNGNCVTLSKAKKLDLLVEVSDYIHIFVEILDAVEYVHGKGYLHNDIKGDNVLLTKDSNFHPVLIDFGKSRKLKYAKMYNLSKEEQKHYEAKYWHIAPELVKGTHKQSFASDVFSFGVMLKSICFQNENKILKRITRECVDENPCNRPSLKVLQNELYKLIS